MNLLFSPHQDDEALFAAFTILRHRPHVVVCFQSERDYGDSAVREQESKEALEILGAASFRQWRGHDKSFDLEAEMRALAAQLEPERVWAPDRQASHPDHVAVAVAAEKVFRNRLTTFHTYNRNGKVREKVPVSFEPQWVQAKLQALARYESQLRHIRAHTFFVEDLLEYYGTIRP